MIVLICIGLIPSTTAWYPLNRCLTCSFQYTISGAVMGILAAYLFTKSPLTSLLGLKDQSESQVTNKTEQPSNQEPSDAPKRVILPKHLTNFNDLRTTVVSSVYY